PQSQSRGLSWPRFRAREASRIQVVFGYEHNKLIVNGIQAFSSCHSSL
ncbi:unnamed protein product, partial [Callosobruchus maculatus]